MIYINLFHPFFIMGDFTHGYVLIIQIATFCSSMTESALRWTAHDPHKAGKYLAWQHSPRKMTTLSEG